MKLADKTTPAALVQISTYSWMLASVQGRTPSQMHLVTGDNKTHTFEVDDFSAYHQMLMDDFEAAVANPPCHLSTTRRALPQVHFQLSLHRNWRGDDDPSQSGVRGKRREEHIKKNVNTVLKLSHMNGQTKIKDIGENAQARIRRETS